MIRSTPLAFTALFVCLTIAASAEVITPAAQADDPVTLAKHLQASLAHTGLTPENRAELMLELAHAQLLQSKFDDANRTLDRIQTDLGQLSPTVSVGYTLERGRVFQLQGNSAKAWRWFHSGVMLARQHQLAAPAIDGMRMLAQLSTGKASLDWYLQAISVAEASDDAQVIELRPMLYNSVGWLYSDLKDNAHALVYLDKALAWQEAHGTTQSKLLARWSVARVTRLSGSYEAALKIDLELEQGWAKLGKADGYVYEEIAECLLALGRDAEARPYFAKAVNLLERDPWVVQQFKARLERMRDLSE
jgi:tetratricopeptide (TPR) repeat protein